MDLQERLTALERRVTDLEAMEGVRDTLGRYAQAVDYAQFDELASIITDDVIVQPGPTWGDRQGKEKAMDFFRDYRGTYHLPHRYVVNERIHVAGNTGTCFAYFLVLHSYDGESYIGWGTYDFLFRLERSVWKIARMVIRIATMTTLKKGWGMEQDRVTLFSQRDKSQ